MKERYGVLIAVILILILGSIPIGIGIIWSKAEAPIDNRYDDTEIKEQLVSLKAEINKMKERMDEINVLMDESFSSLNNQLSTMKTDFNKIWDSYNSLFDYVMRMEATQ